MLSRCNHLPYLSRLFSLNGPLYWTTTNNRLSSYRHRLESRRDYSTPTDSTTSEPSAPSSPPSGSLFSGSESAWDHVFSDIKEMPPLLPSTVRSPRRAFAPDSTDSKTESESPRRSRRQAMTAREISAFDEMFNIIFDAVSEHEQRKPDLSSVGIGQAPGSKVTDFFSKMRGASKKLRWTTESYEELDRKKEEMELCDTDQQLLDWAIREVFGESKRYEEAARKAISDAANGKEPKTMPELQPATYSHLLALLMRTFRDKYRDPHLALSMFDHARHLSIPSYVFGCTTPAYNELIETRWRCFRDLKGVHDALEEMSVNGVETDNRTRTLVEDLRRQVGERNKWQEENELGSGEVWTMLDKIDRLVVARSKNTQKGRRSKAFDEAWKNMALGSMADDDDGWAFGKWGERDAGRR